MKQFVYALVVLAVPTAAAAAGKDLIELRVGKTAYRGQVAAHDDQTLWLLRQNGRLQQVRIDRVAGFKKVSRVFRGMSAADLRDELRKEFGRSFEVAGTTHYLVVAPKGRARVYAELFERTYRKFRSYFSRRGFRLERPPFPMVAIVFPGIKPFGDYASQEGVNVGRGLLGYYHRYSNRVALYDSAGGMSRGDAIPADVAGVVVHEATHQAAFNSGLHSRVGWTPKWVVEGLATVFEAPGIRNRIGRRGAKSRINAGRLTHFRRFASDSRKARSLPSFVCSDLSFRRPLNAYSESWALSFYLVEKKSLEFSQYLQILRKRDPLKPYSAKERLADFQRAFGKDLDRLEVQYLRFIDSLE